MINDYIFIDINQNLERLADAAERIAAALEDSNELVKNIGRVENDY